MPRPHRLRLLPLCVSCAVFWIVLAAVAAAPVAAQPEAGETASQVVIRRTAYGVPHILGEDLRAAGLGLAYAQMEDYGETVLRHLLTARGTLARALGPDHVDSDFRNRPAHAHAVATYHLVSADVRSVMEGFAEGVNLYIRRHPDRLPEWAQPDFTGPDVAARDIGWASPSDVRSFIRLLEEGEDDRVVPGDYATSRPQQHVAPEETGSGLTPDPGSNSWALAPSRTTSGHAILLRNPHLSWDAGYYEAHLTVPGKVNFYGDFRVGGPFTTVGGFNDRLGFSTTNNSPPSHEIYALEVDPARTDHYLFDGRSIPLDRQLISIEFRNGDGLSTVTREYLQTQVGPVIYRDNGWIYVIRAGNHGAFRVGEQFFGMITAGSLDEWQEAMQIRAHPYSNFTYADAAGNIHYVWSGTVPLLPHAAGGDSLAIRARSSDDIWTDVVPYHSLPSLTNPEGGYIRNENDPFHFTNLNEPISGDSLPEYFPGPSLRLRSLHSLELLHNERAFSLEDVVEAKHSMRMLLADRVKDDLIEAVRAAGPTEDVADALQVIERWDNRVARESRGAVLFETWWRIYRERAGTAVRPFEKDAALFREPWTPEEPLSTPRGLADAAAAADAFTEAVNETRQTWGDVGVAWGDVHRARRADLDVPVGGCHGALGCFRTLWFAEDDDGRRRVRGGDGWTFAVEFAASPRAYSILAYGQSNDPASPHHTDQLEMFSRNQMKRVVFRADDIRQATIREYRPGQE